MHRVARLLSRSLVPLVLLGLICGLPLSARSAETPKKSSPGKPKAGAPAAAAKPATIARDPYLGAIVVDASNGRVLFEERADVEAYPASVLKLMNLLIVLDRVRQGQLSMQDPVTVSAKASKIGGSQVWLAEKEVFSVEELLYALMIQSANDAAAALAEKVAGSTEAFVELMNQRARALGMTRTVFRSVHGLPPSAGQQPDITTARDFALLCREVLRYPEALRFTSTRERRFRPQAGDKAVIMRNHNHLLSQVEGCDGLKTGYYAKAGFSIAATAVRGGRRVLVVLLGSADRKIRDAKASEYLAKGFATLAAAQPGPRQP